MTRITFLFHIEELALPVLLLMSHIAANPETIRMRSPATVSGSGIEFATMLLPNIEGVLMALITLLPPRILTEEG
ncbi:MAG: hypothetical protein QGI90_11325 [Nitrospinaceae bacterium]|nr:hypothetical protein [Nitrospinaceae bacterium]